MSEKETKAGTRLLAVLAALGAASMVATGSMAQSTEAPGAGTESAQPWQNAPTEWPCEQPLRPELSFGALWQGPEPDEQSDWRTVPAVASLVHQITPRRVPQEEAVASIRRFAAGYQGEERTMMLTELFVGVFDTLNAERNDIVRGIKRFYRRQDALANRIEEGWKKLGDTDPGTTDPETVQQRISLEQQVHWDSRIFDDRQRLLPAVCEQPRVLEQRAFALSRAIQGQLAVTQ